MPFLLWLMEQMQEHIKWGKHQRNRTQELDEYMEGWTSGILEGIANSVTHHTRLVRFTLLSENRRRGVEPINHFAGMVDSQAASLNWSRLWWYCPRCRGHR